MEMYHLIQRNGAIGKGNESKNRTQSIEPIIISQCPFKQLQTTHTQPFYSSAYNALGSHPSTAYNSSAAAAAVDLPWVPNSRPFDGSCSGSTPWSEDGHSGRRSTTIAAMRVAPTVARGVARRSWFQLSGGGLGGVVRELVGSSGR